MGSRRINPIDFYDSYSSVKPFNARFIDNALHHETIGNALAASGVLALIPLPEFDRQVDDTIGQRLVDVLRPGGREVEPRQITGQGDELAAGDLLLDDAGRDGTDADTIQRQAYDVQTEPEQCSLIRSRRC